MRLRTLALVTGVLCGLGVCYVALTEEFKRPARQERIAFSAPISYVPAIGDPHQAEFTICSGPIRANCVVDGDTFCERIVTRMGGDRVRASFAQRIEPCPEGVSPELPFAGRPITRLNRWGRIDS